MRIYLFVTILIFGCITIQAQQRLQSDCSSAVPNRIAYKVGFLSHAVEDPNSLIVQISLKSRDFSRTSLLVLVRQLRKDYCNYEKLSVVFFDNPKLAKDPARAMVALVESNQRIVLVRGFYNLDRRSGSEGLEFSTKRGNSTKEVTVGLKDGQPI